MFFLCHNLPVSDGLYYTRIRNEVRRTTSKAVPQQKEKIRQLHRFSYVLLISFVHKHTRKDGVRKHDYMYVLFFRALLFFSLCPTLPPIITLSYIRAEKTRKCCVCMKRCIYFLLMYRTLLTCRYIFFRLFSSSPSESRSPDGVILMCIAAAAHVC